MHYNQIDIARTIAYIAHRGQFRRDKVTPYIEHPKAVAESLWLYNEDVIATAWLHDVVEDTNFTMAELYSLGVNNSILLALQFLTKQKNTSYEDYIRDICTNAIAKQVKLADIQHNLSGDPTPHQKAKYELALKIINADQN